MSDSERSSLAERINHLFTVVRPAATAGSGRRQEYSNEHVAREIARVSGVSISQSYIWQLRKGKKDNPTLRHLHALAEFFGVPAAYFFDDQVTTRVDRQLAMLAEEQSRRELNREGRDGDAHDQVTVMALRAGALSPERRQQVMDLLDVVYRLERAERAARHEEH